MGFKTNDVMQPVSQVNIITSCKHNFFVQKLVYRME